MIPKSRNQLAEAIIPLIFMCYEMNEVNPGATINVEGRPERVLDLLVAGLDVARKHLDDEDINNMLNERPGLRTFMVPVNATESYDQGAC